MARLKARTQVPLGSLVSCLVASPTASPTFGVGEEGEKARGKSADYSRPPGVAFSGCQIFSSSNKINKDLDSQKDPEGPV